MSPSEWAAVLADTPVRELGQACRECSDEDWVPDEFREWLRTGHEGYRKPNQYMGVTGAALYWFNAHYRQKMPGPDYQHHVPSKLFARLPCTLGSVSPTHGEYSTDAFPSLEAAWLALFDAMLAQPAPSGSEAQGVPA